MHRFYLPADRVAGTELVLRGAEAHHAQHVLRIRGGERCAILDGEGHNYVVEASSFGKGEVVFRVLGREAHAGLRCRITLVQGLTKPKSMDLIIQKAVELGVSRIVPVQAERSLSQMVESEAERKVEKWRAIAIEALKQSGCLWLPVIEAPVNVGQCLSEGAPSELALVAALQSGSRHPRACLEAFVAARHRYPESIAVWVGPEGDFTPAEVSAIQGAGAVPITLGPQVLRSETAALYCLAILSYESQLFGLRSA